MRLGRRRLWFWFLVSWCVAAGLVGAAVTARPGPAAIMFLATTLVALEAGLATTRRRSIVTLVTAFVMAIVVLLAAFAATAKPASGVLLGVNPVDAAFQFNSFQLQATPAVTLGGTGVAALVVTLLLGLQLSRTTTARALEERSASHLGGRPVPDATAPLSVRRPSRGHQSDSTTSTEPDDSMTAAIPTPQRAVAGRGRRRARWRWSASSEKRAAVHPARTSTSGPGSPPPLQGQHLADSSGHAERHVPLRPRPEPARDRSQQVALNPRSSVRAETEERGAATTEEPIPPAAAAAEVDRTATTPEIRTLVLGMNQAAEPSLPAGEGLTESERAMRAALARLAYVREDLRPRGVRGTVDLEGLVCPSGVAGSVGPISACIRPGELIMLTCDGPAGRTETVLRVLHGDRPPGRGQAMVGGYNLRHVRTYTVRRLHRVVGYVEALDGGLTAAAALESVLHRFELLTTGAGVHYRKCTDVIVAMHAVGLEGRLGTRLAELPVLEQRLIAFAAALLHSPSILLVDEPTAGLDWSGRQVVDALLGRLQAADLTVVVGTSDSRLLRRHRARVLHL